MCKDNKIILCKGWRCICLRVRLIYIRLRTYFYDKVRKYSVKGSLFSIVMRREETKKKKWMQNKGYVHIDIPFTPKQRKWLYGYVTNREAIAHHAFLPLIRRNVKTYPFKRDIGGVRKRKTKSRKLTFASHIDAAIFAYYAEQLQTKYELYISKLQIGEVITAYRKIKSERHKGNKCNIDFAFDVFSYIRENVTETKPLDVITFDIKGFFDNLNPKILKEKWLKVLGKTRLDDDEYAIYKHTTHYSYVNETELFRLFKERIVCKRRDGKLVNRKIKHTDYFRNNGAIAYCQKANIDEIRKKKLIRPNKTNKGIPQGLPISSTLANVYMIDFDNDIKCAVDKVGGIYRRYSDDIIVVCHNNASEKLMDLILHKIGDVELSIERSKTNLYHFTKNGEVLKCEHSERGSREVLKYLGFSFDGNHIRLKESSICKFYSKMRKAVRRSIYFAIHINNDTKGKIFKHHLIRRYTFAGSQTHSIYKRSRETKKFYLLKGMKTHGNFLTYVEKSSSIMNEPMIKRQMRRCTSKLKKCIEEGEVCFCQPF